MKSANLLSICTVALGTAAVTVATLGTGPLEAGKDGTPAENPKPKLVAHGVELSLAAANGQVFKAGDSPVLELTARNTNAAPAELWVRLAVSETGPADLLSRVVRMPTVLCQQDQRLSLQPNETKTMVLSPQTKLPANKFIAVSLREVDASKAGAPAGAPLTQPTFRFPAPGTMTLLSFSTLVPKAQPLASAPSLVMAK